MSFSQLTPTQQNLSHLLEKLLTVFGVRSILEDGYRASDPIQDNIDIDFMIESMFGLDLGNEPQLQASVVVSPPWKALLQLDQDGEPDKVCLPLCNLTLRPEFSDKTTVTKLAEQAAQLLRSAWPKADDVGPSKYRQFGPPFADPDMPDYQLFRWLASKDLSEYVFLADLYHSENMFYRPLGQKPVRFLRLPYQFSCHHAGIRC